MENARRSQARLQVETAAAHGAAVVFVGRQRRRLLAARAGAEGGVLHRGTAVAEPQRRHDARPPPTQVALALLAVPPRRPLHHGLGLQLGALHAFHTSGQCISTN